jgi:hypothetical protein
MGPNIRRGHNNVLAIMYVALVSCVRILMLV